MRSRLLLLPADTPILGTMLQSFSAKNFRGFADLELGPLGAVNLIVGRNSSGKSSMLEAIELFNSQGHYEVTRRLVEQRNENRVSDKLDALTHLKSLCRVAPEEGAPAFSFWAAAGGNTIGTEYSFYSDKLSAIFASFGYRVVDSNGAVLWDASIKGDGEIRSKKHYGEAQLFPLAAAPFGGVDLEDLSISWDRLALTDLEAAVEDALRLIVPNARRIGFLQVSKDRRAPFISTDSGGPYPLRRWGDGAVRLFQIAVQMLNAKDGLFLADEIENGLHYLIQDDLWRLVFKLSAEHNIQVFATTHSLDCITAFARIAQTFPDQGTLIRLERHDGQVTATRYSEQELAIAAKHNIEVR